MPRRRRTCACRPGGQSTAGMQRVLARGQLGNVSQPPSRFQSHDKERHMYLEPHRDKQNFHRRL
ncbi:hypothetical protein CCMA1212_002078 [Trichoderma ghanense]|uniref:Uncharacterized protein n=1 Tax=Trichoderma ghanense TaxID=65468 RepID=A0ABY2HCY6_9HYPO